MIVVFSNLLYHPFESDKALSGVGVLITPASVFYVRPDPLLTHHSGRMDRMKDRW
jgi:hypothetical protein